jgi:hypothetical protein
MAEQAPQPQCYNAGAEHVIIARSEAYSKFRVG